jgi:formylglycine-generating enzyme required for sulfatase activity
LNLPAPFEWRAIPAGTVTLAGDAGTFDVAAFDMAQYPITNAQFQAFVDDDGFGNAAWWNYSPKAQRWRAQNGEYETPFPDDDLPRVKVSWFEAVAFCRWLSAKTGDQIALPTEQEWQRAAQGDDGRRFPWGDAFEVDRCNTSESMIKRPTPVEKYPDGASPYGVMDLSGNVAEWCLNAYLIASDTDIETFAGGEARASRGGSWGLSHPSALIASRGFNRPEDRFEFQGFRVARHR